MGEHTNIPIFFLNIVKPVLFLLLSMDLAEFHSAISLHLVLYYCKRMQNGWVRCHQHTQDDPRCITLLWCSLSLNSIFSVFTLNHSALEEKMNPRKTTYVCRRSSLMNTWQYDLRQHQTDKTVGLDFPVHSIPKWLWGQKHPSPPAADQERLSFFP